MRGALGTLTIALLTPVCVWISWTQRGSEEKDRAAINELVQGYYSALGASDYTKAATCYEPAVALAIAASGHRLTDALQGAVKLSGQVPDSVTLDALRFDDQNRDKAKAELILPKRAENPAAETTYGPRAKPTPCWVPGPARCTLPRAPADGKLPPKALPPRARIQRKL